MKRIELSRNKIQRHFLKSIQWKIGASFWRCFVTQNSLFRPTKNLQFFLSFIYEFVQRKRVEDFPLVRVNAPMTKIISQVCFFFISLRQKIQVRSFNDRYTKIELKIFFLFVGFGNRLIERTNWRCDSFQVDPHLPNEKRSTDTSDYPSIRRWHLRLNNIRRRRDSLSIKLLLSIFNENKYFVSSFLLKVIRRCWMNEKVELFCFHYLFLNFRSVGNCIVSMMGKSSF